MFFFQPYVTISCTRSCTTGLVTRLMRLRNMKVPADISSWLSTPSAQANEIVAILSAFPCCLNNHEGRFERVIGHWDYLWRWYSLLYNQIVEGTALTAEGAAFQLSVAILLHDLTMAITGGKLREAPFEYTVCHRTKGFWSILVRMWFRWAEGSALLSGTQGESNILNQIVYWYCSGISTGKFPLLEEEIRQTITSIPNAARILVQHIIDVSCKLTLDTVLERSLQRPLQLMAVLARDVEVFHETLLECDSVPIVTGVMHRLASYAVKQVRKPSKKTLDKLSVWDTLHNCKSYIAWVISGTGGIPYADQAFKNGVIHTIFKPFAMGSQPNAMESADLNLMQVIAMHTIFPPFLATISRAMKKVEASGVMESCPKDSKLWEAWARLRTLVQDRLDVKRIYWNDLTFNVCCNVTVCLSRLLFWFSLAYYCVCSASRDVSL